ncbi:putative restriction endonuclease [Paraburkholderia sp. WC7.3g]|uniref:hypothetical protein n=1 Tax=Paraburkholderia sp. WC7.3g TaxID=2991070 RepID=UPI003D1EB51D
MLDIARLLTAYEKVVWQNSRTTPQVMRGDLTGYENFDKQSEFGKIKAPVMLLRGDADWHQSSDAGCELPNQRRQSRGAAAQGFDA